MEVSASSIRVFIFVGLFAIIATAGVKRVEGAGAPPCGKSSLDNEAMKLVPCASAVQDANADVSASCCAQVRRIGQSPSCLCAVMLSDTAKSSGIDPQVAMTIPKRCNITNRPMGYKCGPYTLP